MLRLRREQIEQAVTDPWTDAVDAREFVRRRAVDGQQPVLEVGHQDECVGAFDDTARRLRSATASMTRRSSVSSSSRSARSARTFCVVSETAQNIRPTDRPRRGPANTRT